MIDGGTISVFMLRSFTGAAALAGVDVDGLLRDVGLDPGAPSDPDVRIPAPLAFRAFEEAAARAGDPDFALHLAEKVPLGAVGFLDYHTRASPTIEEALRRTIRYFALINDRMEAALDVDGDTARLWQRGRGGAKVPRQVAEFQIAMIVVRGRLLAGTDWPLRSVAFAHARPASTAAHERLFRTAVLFEQPRDEIAFDAAFLSPPLPTADPVLSSVLERYAQSLVARLPVTGSVLDDARRAVAELLKDGDPSLEATAARLGASRRTLQRRLQEHGTSHHDLVDGVRRDLALKLLADPKTSITEAAYLLGFSEPAAFFRAFKRWTGKTPAEHRRVREGRSVPPPPPDLSAQTGNHEPDEPR
jgi:AraC-like DNA-binding protein